MFVLLGTASADYIVTVKFKTSSVGPGLVIKKIEVLNSVAGCGAHVDVGTVGGVNYNVDMASTGGWDEVLIFFDVNNADLGCDYLKTVNATLYKLCPNPVEIPTTIRFDNITTYKNPDEFITNPKLQRNVCVLRHSEGFIKEGDFAVVVWYADTEKGAVLEGVPIRTAFSSGPFPQIADVDAGGGFLGISGTNVCLGTIQVDATIKVKMNRKILTANVTLTRSTPCGNPIGDPIPVQSWIDKDYKTIIIAPCENLQTNTMYIIKIEGQDCIQGYPKDC
jgi:hypothetical protein